MTNMNGIKASNTKGNTNTCALFGWMFASCTLFYLLLSKYACNYLYGTNGMWTNEIQTLPSSLTTSRTTNSDKREIFISNPLYFANELSLHTELINHSYCDEIEQRKFNFEKELIEFEKISRDLLNGNIDSFQHLSRYYVHPSKYNEYKREYIVNKWENNVKHISENELIGGHPSCPIINNENDLIKNNINTIELHFTHNCCKKTQPPHEQTAYDLGKWKTVYHYTMQNLTYDFYQANKHILTQRKGGGKLFIEYVSELLDISLHKKHIQQTK